MDLTMIFTNGNKNGNIGEMQKVKRNSIPGQGKKVEANREKDIPQLFEEGFQVEDVKVLENILIDHSENIMAGIENIFMNKMDINKINPLKMDLRSLSDEIVKMKNNLMGLENQAKGLMDICNVLTTENAMKEREMSLEFESKKKYFEDTLEDLQSRDNYLKNICNCYQSAYNISVKKENNTYICITTMKDQEISFMFSINGVYTTYTPIKVCFASNNFLNYKIEDLNRNELAILFIRLMKLILTR
ncbi:hypothetical protein SteCoe_17509 [Stentor coeruleus]|uniref:Kinetochore protein SPC25 n=1 Tax=Stentor coeruleus TaxID=5963 RepID=A0A1R2BYQ9_9CILI|nr:hypothetical protein SteCoe_17509 [Stentor coeruleus]